MSITVLIALFVGLLIGGLVPAVIPTKGEVNTIASIILGATSAAIATLSMMLATEPTGFDIAAIGAGAAAAIVACAIFAPLSGRP
ncbi:hypothetical protein K0651_12235 [Ornithinimicrobium sp. Arc0846-15]|nr:hypothetical protein [Ornithinimicrobium laminariae]